MCGWVRFSHHLFVWLLEAHRALLRKRLGFSHHLFVWLLEATGVPDQTLVRFSHHLFVWLLEGQLPEGGWQ